MDIPCIRHKYIIYFIIVAVLEEVQLRHKIRKKKSRIIIAKIVPGGSVGRNVSIIFDNFQEISETKAVMVHKTHPGRMW